MLPLPLLSDRISGASYIIHHHAASLRPTHNCHYIMKHLRLPPGRRSAAFTLVEMMIVLAIICLLASIAVPGFLRARKRAQANSIRSDLRMIDSAMDQYALEYNKPANSTITVTAWQLYMKPGTRLYNTNTDIFGDSYGSQQLGVLPPVPAAAWDSLSDVADGSFWAPYIKGP